MIQTLNKAKSLDHKRTFRISYKKNNNPFKHQTQNFHNNITYQKNVVLHSSLVYKSKTHTPQDSLFFLENTDLKALGIFDGHGKCGHVLSQKASQIFCKHINKKSVINKNIMDELFNKVKNNFQKRLDSFDSGTTANILVIKQNKIVIGNLGDSRCIILKKMLETNHWTILFESVDHKPINCQQKLRIQSIGGFISKKYGISRLTRYGSNAGFTVSRSFGDLNYHSLGIISTPDLSELSFFLSKKVGSKKKQLYSMILIIQGSDGLWQHTKESEVVDIVNDSFVKNEQDLDRVNSKLLKLSIQRWNKQNTDDDISINTCLIK